MAACAGCKKGISPSDFRKAVTDRDPQGRIRAVYHSKCWGVARRGTTNRAAQDRYSEAPTAYEMAQGIGRVTATDLSEEERERRRRAEEQYAALQRRRKVIEEEQVREERPTGFADWREPSEAEVEELLELVSRDPATEGDREDAKSDVRGAAQD